MAIYNKISKNIHELTIDNPSTPDDKLTWIDVRSKRKKEIEFLRKNYKFSLAHLQISSIKAVAQRPNIEKGDGYTFMILHFPVYKDGHIASGEIEFFIGDDYLITLHNNELHSLKSFFSSAKKDNQALKSFKFESSTVLLYEILERLMLDSFTLLDKNSIILNDIEETIFAQESKQAVSDILTLRRNIINTRRIMQNHKNIIKKLSEYHTGFVDEKTVKIYYNDLLEHSKRFWEYLELQKEMIEVLNSTNESMLNYQISDVMKTLTIFSVIVFPLTLFAAIFGMNTMNSMPFLNSPYDFWIVVSIMFVGCLGMIMFFYKKKWL